MFARSSWGNFVLFTGVLGVCVCVFFHWIILSNRYDSYCVLASCIGKKNVSRVLNVKKFVKPIRDMQYNCQLLLVPENNNVNEIASVLRRILLKSRWLNFLFILWSVRCVKTITFDNTMYFSFGLMVSVLLLFFLYIQNASIELKYFYFCITCMYALSCKVIFLLIK